MNHAPIHPAARPLSDLNPECQDCPADACDECDALVEAMELGRELVECPVTPQDGELRRAVE